MATMAAIELFRIAGVEPLHAVGQLAICGSKEQMSVVAHEAVGMTFKLGPLGDLGEYVKESLAINLIDKNGCMVDATICYVMPSAWKISPPLSRHEIPLQN